MGDESARDAVQPSQRQRQHAEPYEHERRPPARLVRTAYVYDDGSVVYADANDEKGVVVGEDADAFERGVSLGVRDTSVASPTRTSFAARAAAATAGDAAAVVDAGQLQLTTTQKPQNPQKPPRLGDAAPLALMAFGSTTMLFCSHVAGTSPMNSTTISMLMFYGGLTQLICGILETINRNTFGFSAFCTYGAFWLHLASSTLLPAGGALSPSTPGYEGGHAVVWFAVSASFLFSSLKQPLVTIAVFATLTLFFVIYGIGNFVQSPKMCKAAGYEGMVCGGLAIYLAASLLLRDAYDGLAILPIFHHRGWRITAL